MRVGTKELKNRLSYYLRRVRQGEAVEVTDRGAVVAELRAATRQVTTKDEAALELLAGQGVVTLPARKGRHDVSPTRPKRPVRLSGLIDEDRG